MKARRSSTPSAGGWRMRLNPKAEVIRCRRTLAEGLPGCASPPTGSPGRLHQAFLLDAGQVSSPATHALRAGPRAFGTGQGWAGGGEGVASSLRDALAAGPVPICRVLPPTG